MDVMPESCLEFAERTLSERAIKDTTYASYMTTLRVLGLAEVPYHWVNLRMLTDKLNRVLTPSTRRKHAINLRAALGIHVPCPKSVQRVYALPEHDRLHNVIDASPYRMYGMSMLYAGMRIGESCVKQLQSGRTINIDRQRRPDGKITQSKTQGPVTVPDWFAEEYMDWTPTLHPSSVYYGLKRCSKKLGVPLTQQMLRHCFATNLVAHGATPEILRMQMRHHDVSMSLQYYVQTTQEQVNDVVARMGGQHV